MMAGAEKRRYSQLTGKVNIVHYVTKKYMQQNRKRTFTTLAGIVFMVLLMTCVFVGRDTAVDYLQSVASVKDGKWHFGVYNVTEEQQRQIEGLGYIKEMAASVELGMTEFPQSGREERPYLNVKAYGEPCFDWYNIRLTEGRLPQNEKELVISDACLEDGAGVQVGDTIQAAYFNRTLTGLQKDKEEKLFFPYYGLEVGWGQTVELPQQFPYYAENDSFRVNQEMTGEQGSYTVVGFIEAPSFEGKDGAGYTALTLFAGSLSGREGRRNLSLILDWDKAPDTCGMALEQIAGEENVDQNNVYLAFTGNSSDSTMNLMVNLMTVFFVALIMFASVILIYNVFNLSFRERCRYLGMLSSVGATSRQKRSSVYYEAFHLLLFALPVGILLGFGVVWLGMSILQPYMVQFVYAGTPVQKTPVALQVSAEALLSVAAASVLTVLLSAFLPAWKIGKAGAVESIRGKEGTGNRIYKMKGRHSGKLAAERMLAGNFLKRQRRKQRGISLAVVVFLVILLVTAFGTDSIHTVLENKVSNEANIKINLQEDECALYYVQEDSGKKARRVRAQYDALKEEVASRPGVESVREWYEDMFCCNLDASFFSEEYWDAYRSIAKAYLGGKMTEEEIEGQYIQDHTFPANILVVDDGTLKELAKRCGADYGLLSDAGRRGVIVMNETALSTDEFRFEMGTADRYLYYDIENISGLKEGSTFTAGFYPRKGQEVKDISFTISAYADNDMLSGYAAFRGGWPWFIMGHTVAGQLAKECGYSHISKMAAEELFIIEGDKGELWENLERFAEENEGVGFTKGGTADIQKTIMETIADIVDILFFCFVLLTSGICLMNLGNAIGGRMAGRRMEFATLQSVGMTRAQIRRMLLLECGGILLRSLAAAVVISSACIWLVREVLSSLFGHLVLGFPWLFILLAVAFGAGAVLFLTLYSFGRVREENLLEDIRNESI